MRFPAALLAVAISAAALAGVAWGASPDPTRVKSGPTFVIQGYWNIGGFSPTRDGTLDGAIGLFGKPSSAKPAPQDQPQNFCTIRWAVYGITMKTYLIAEPGQNCTPETKHSTTSLTDPRWRTLKGLRIGDKVQKLMHLYPTSNRTKGGWWALLTKDLYGIGEQWPMVQARVASGRVTEFLVFFPAGGE